MKYILYSIMLLALIPGCGDPEGTPDAVETTGQEARTVPSADVQLTIADSIGVEMGDSNYVFGGIIGVAYTPSGNIAVLDMQKHSVSIYSPEGEFLQSVGRHGSGPGEFMLPAGMAFQPNGALIVSDAMGGKLEFFDENYAHTGKLDGFFPSPPANLVAIDTTSFMGMKPTFLQEGSEMLMGFMVGRWTMDSNEPEVVYYENMSPFDPSDMSSMGEDIVFFSAASDGTVFTAGMDSEEYSFTAWSGAGEELFTYTKEDYQMVEKTPEEIEEEREFVNQQMISRGMPAEMANWEPEPWKAAIGALYVDDYDRLWISRGTENVPYFDVYSLQGEPLFTAVLDTDRNTDYFAVMISGEGFLAFDANADDYPRVFHGSIPEE